MRRVDVEPRQDWRATAEAHGFTFHTIDGEVYWDESACYQFSLKEIEEGLEAPAEAIEEMCFAVVDAALRDERSLERLKIPREHWAYVAQSWTGKERNLYGRMDFSFDGSGPAKLYEYNADTPTSLYESSIFQWVWLEQAIERGIIPDGADQFNSIHERLVAGFGKLGIAAGLHLASATGSEEDRATVEYVSECARQAGLQTKMLSMGDIGVTREGWFSDLEDQRITTLFKLYPWEWILREDFAQYLSRSGCRFIEPAWKSVISNKGVLALLWEKFPGHPNLLPTYFEDDPKASSLGQRYVKKPIYSREGANVEIVDGAGEGLHMPGPYGEEGHIVQAYHPLPEHAGNRALCGVWMVASEPAGLGMREDKSLVTTNLARFLPHMILA